MASAGLLALIDDIATLLDDVALLSKVAAKKTASVLSDDLALNAEQVAGVRAEREIPVVLAVAKGSALNKLILVPAALFLSAVAAWSIQPLLMLGGAYLCFEGFEKIFHALFHKAEVDNEKKAVHDALIDPDIDLVEFERKKIKGAIRTDFILSAEIIVITLGIVQDVSFTQQILVLCIMAAGITVGVYGVVAGIVKLDDAGLYLMSSSGSGLSARFKRRVGELLLGMCPYLMKSLSIVGTAAMFLVGGGILLHGTPNAHVWLQYITDLPYLSLLPEFVISTLSNAVAGLIAGGVLVSVFTAFRAVLPDRRV